jgi:hypothetical protein
VLRGRNQGAPDPATGALGRADATQGIDNGAAHRGHVEHPDLSSRRFRQDPGSHPIEQNAILRLEHAAAENHFHIRPDEVQAADERTRHDGHFITERGENAHCYRVSGGRRLEQHGREHAKRRVRGSEAHRPGNMCSRRHRRPGVDRPRWWRGSSGGLLERAHTSAGVVPPT